LGGGGAGAGRGGKEEREDGERGGERVEDAGTEKKRKIPHSSENEWFF